MAGGLQQRYNRVDNPAQVWNWHFRDFEGLNTQAHRSAIADQEFAWLENIMPIGHGNLKVVPAPTGSLQTFNGQVAYYRLTYNVGGVDFLFVVCQDGSAYQIRLTTPFTRTQVAAAAGLSTSGVSAAQWNNAGLVIIDPAKGYLDWNITAPNTLTVIDATKKGSAIAVYAGRVWLTTAARTVAFTDAGSYNSFAGSGGSFIMNDPTLHSSIIDLFTANGFLYIWGTDSVDTISNVRVVAGVAVFSRVNIQSLAGTNNATSIFPYFRSLMFASPYGFYELLGATPNKISDKLDGIYPLIDLTQPITGGVGVVNGIVCAAFCFTYTDPVLGSRQLLALYFGGKQGAQGKWFLASQGTIKAIYSAPINGTPTLFGDDGTQVFQLFGSTSGNVSWTAQTKLWSFQSSLYWKNVLRAGMNLNLPVIAVSVNVSIDSERASNVYAISPSSALVFVGAGPITFVGGGVITFVGIGFKLFDADVTNSGRFIGMTISSTSPQAQVTELDLQYQEMGANWG